ncbi:MAG: hypothetical protein KAU91_00910, partial [Candidatus Aminicenantes bacterium]|nr:hypothetical protein [Candidatus Aminicenantes bacterium]
MEQKLTMKSKKEEILKKYEGLLAKYKEKEKIAKGMDKEAKEVAQKTVVEKAAAYTVEGIVKGLANLKLDLSK